MNRTVARQMIAAEILTVRRHRATMTTALVLTIGITVLYFTVIELRHGGGFGGAHILSDGAALMGIYFGSFAAILIGTEAGTIDVASGVFRDLVATGRSRSALFLARVPAAIVVALAFTLSGFVLAVVTAFAFRGSATAPGLSLIVHFGLWVVLATTVVTSLAVSVGSLTNSRSLTLTMVIGFETIVTSLLYTTHFLGSARDVVLLIALGHVWPGTAYRTTAHPGSSNALPMYVLPMATVTAVIVILAWATIPAIVGVWHTKNQDA